MGYIFLLGIILCGLNTFIPAAMGQFINMFNVETTYSAMLKIHIFYYCYCMLVRKLSAMSIKYFI